MDEFALIRTVFQQSQLTEAGPALAHSADQGIGDDCSLMSLPLTSQLAQSIDTLVAGVHFPIGADPMLIGYRALAVSVSDLAAMGAKPHSFSLALTIPEQDVGWLTQFANGLAAIAQNTGISLIGGDTTRGPLTITIQVQGTVVTGTALLRSSAQSGDKIYVSGTPGEASGALPYVLGERPVVSAHQQRLVDRFWRPTPRLDLGQWLVRQGATGAIDLSDGLSGDLSHILQASCCGAQIFRNQLPVSEALATVCGSGAIDKVLHGGDDYELCFTWPGDRALPTDIPTQVSCIGQIISDHGLWLDGSPLMPGSYNHFPATG